jgi:hypothetical protein
LWRQRPQRASASKAKSSVLSHLSGLENVVFNDFIDNELDSEDVSEQRASASFLLEDVPQDIVIKTLKVSCACVPVLVFACVCVCVCVRARACARDVDVCS